MIRSLLGTILSSAMILLLAGTIRLDTAIIETKQMSTDSMTAPAKRCEAAVYDDEGCNPVQCQNMAKHELDGVYACGEHQNFLLNHFPEEYREDQSNDR
jgi:hypothetical protein